MGWHKSLLFASVLTATVTTASAQDHPLPLLPVPQSVVLSPGHFALAERTAIGIPVGDKGAAVAARLLVAQLRSGRGIDLQVVEGAAPVRFVRDGSVVGDEAYRVTVVPTGIVVSASGDRGLLYGATTVAQLASADGRTGGPANIPAVTIADAPRFAWRGLMIDVARHFQPINFLYRTVEQMAQVKLNVLHLHLSDDQGWRFEVRKYPRLTEVGAWRTPPSSGGAPGPVVGGFYTQDELKALVAFAAERGITIVPEIDLPGHAQALVAAYPEHGSLGDRPAVGVDWGINPYLINPSPRTVRFVEDVLDELMEVFPSRYIHLGGDEAVKDQWERSPEVQARMRAVGAKSEMDMQGWLIAGFADHLAKKGRRLIGWDEILEATIPATAGVMSWRGETGAVTAAARGHDVVLSPAPLLYFDNLQSDLPDEPPGRIGTQTLADIYAYDVLPKGLDPAKAHHVLGAQANAWSEYLVTAGQVEHNVYPRIAALAEVTWSAPKTRDFAGFSRRLLPQIARWKRNGVDVSDSAYAVGYTVTGGPTAALRAGRARITLATQVPLGTIRYTLDGSTPSPRSRVYSAPLNLKPGPTIRATAFLDGAALAAPRAFATDRASLMSRTTSGLTACPDGKLLLRMPLTTEATSNAPVFNLDIFNTCSVYPAAPLDLARTLTIDVARLPRNFGLAHEYTKLRAHYNVTPHGELLVTAGCPSKDGPKVAPIAAFPLPAPATSPARMQFSAPVPAGSAATDLCLQFTSPLGDPLYAVERIALAGDKN